MHVAYMEYEYPLALSISDPQTLCQPLHVAASVGAEKYASQFIMYLLYTPIEISDFRVAYFFPTIGLWKRLCCYMAHLSGTLIVRLDYIRLMPFSSLLLFFWITSKDDCLISIYVLDFHLRRDVLRYTMRRRMKAC